MGDDALTLLEQLKQQYQPIGISEAYHEESKIKLRKDDVDPNSWPQAWRTVFFKGYPRLPKQKLPIPVNTPLRQPLLTILQNRRSSRTFDDSKVLSIPTISTLLYYVAGIREVHDSDWNTSRRFYPSAGARYPLEVYLLVLRNSEVQPGLYHYYLKSHSLEALKLGTFPDAVTESINPAWIENANALLIISSVFGRNHMKYGERGYRHILVENGILTESVYLVSAALGLGCCAFGGFVDDAVNDLVGLDGTNEAVTSVLSIGYPVKQRSAEEKG